MSRLIDLLSNLKPGVSVIKTFEHGCFAVAVVAMRSQDPDRAKYDAEDFTIVHNQDYTDPVARPQRDYVWVTDSEVACKQAQALFDGFTLAHDVIALRRKVKKATELALKKAAKRGVPTSSLVVTMQPWEFGMMKPEPDEADNEGSDPDIDFEPNHEPHAYLEAA